MLTHPIAGPHDTVAATPSLADGAVRRTMSTAIERPGGFDRDAVIRVAGRDIRDRTVLDDVAGELSVDPVSGAITEVRLEGAPYVVGLSLRSGWMRAIAPLVGDDRSLTASLFEDLGGAFLVSGYAALRAGLIGAAGEYAAQAADAQADVCAGWARGGAAEVYLRTSGMFAAPMGPDASTALIDDGWHRVDATEPHTVRRMRRLDVRRVDGGVELDAYFRDTYTAPDAVEMVMHEYTVAARADSGGVITSIAVEARVLPWDTCPNAVASAQSVVGLSLDALPDHARRELRGPSTCTHLTSTLRALADASWLRQSE
jgi:hypothetical protein